MLRRMRYLVCGLLVGFAGCGDSGDGGAEADAGIRDTDAGTPELGVEYTEARDPCSERDPHRRLLFGDLHVHTALSFDAYGYDVRTSPAQAYAFAKGAQAQLPPLDADGRGTREVALDRPLDFAALTDHLDLLGEVNLCTTPGSASYDAAGCEAYRIGGPDAVAAFGVQLTTNPAKRLADVCVEGDAQCRTAASAIWQDVVAAAEEAYDTSASCAFTALVGYEYTGSPKVANNHRNVIFRNANVPELPPSYFEAPSEQSLWQELDNACLSGLAGCDAIAIPHNSNWSNGNLYALDYPGTGDEATEAEAARARARFEPIAELHQHKGDMECRNGFEGLEEDPLCDFEKINPATAMDCGDTPGSFGVASGGCVSRYDFLRNVFRLGLEEQARIGENPFRVGVIGSTDTHNGTAGFTLEHAFAGHVGLVDDTPEKRFGEGTVTHKPKYYNPGGLTAVWSFENSRDAIFDALRRRETYSTSGTRLAVRFFGGWDYPADICERAGRTAEAYAGGVPMGGELAAKGDQAPVFVVWADADPGSDARKGTPLSHIQIIKGWVDEAGQTHEHIHDVAGDPLAAEPVDLASCTVPTGGARSLCARFEDPDFDPKQHAFYYARVLEVQSCRWTQYDCNQFETDASDRPAGCDDPGIAKQIEERAITSPIWYLAP